jgi:hypothetical protein
MESSSQSQRRRSDWERWRWWIVRVMVRKGEGQGVMVGYEAVEKLFWGTEEMS